MYDSLAQRIGECDAKTQALLAPLGRQDVDLGKAPKERSKLRAAFDVRQALVHRSENPETVWCSRGQGLTFIGPAEGLCHGPIEEVDEVGDLCLKVIERGEIAAADDLPRED